MEDPGRGSFATDVLTCLADSPILTDVLHFNSDYGTAKPSSGSFHIDTQKVTQMPKKQTPGKQSRYPWGGERPSVIERRCQATLQQLPAKRQKLLDDHRQLVEEGLAELDRQEEVAKQKLETLANYRKEIHSKERASSLRLTRLLGTHLGVSPEKAKTVLARMTAKTKSESPPAPSTAVRKVASSPAKALPRRRQAQQTQKRARTRTSR